jgi:hypothetical protein
MKTVLARLMGCGLALLATAAGPRKEAWKWTLEERMDARFAQTRPASAGGDRSVTGKENPELLLPTELFRNLVDLTLVPEDPRFRAHYQEMFRIRARAANLGDDFLSGLEDLTKDDARKRWGESFDRFLYTAVAPETNVATDMNRDRLLFMERGCS